MGTSNVINDVHKIVLVANQPGRNIPLKLRQFEQKTIGGWNDEITREPSSAVKWLTRMTLVPVPDMWQSCKE